MFDRKTHVQKKTVMQDQVKNHEHRIFQTILYSKVNLQFFFGICFLQKIVDKVFDIFDKKYDSYLTIS